MADPIQYRTLLDSLEKASGRRFWLEFKLRSRWIDLSTADFTQHQLRDYDLSDINLSTAIFLEADLSGTDLSDANLALCDLRKAELRDACLDRANLQGANLQGANLMDARMDSVNLHGARLAGARLVGADLAGADLRDADLRGANLKYARLSGANLEGANVAEADLTGVVMDDLGPSMLRNFDLAIVDDRKYRQLRSRLTSMPAVIKPGPDGTGGSSAGAGKAFEKHETLEHRQGQKARQARAAGKSKAPAEPAPAAPFEGEAAAAAFPIRETEPDLATTQGCCEVLGIDANATMDQIVKAFRRKAKVFHPDMVRHLAPKLQELAAEEFQRLHRAYERLTRATTRSLDGIRWADGVPRRPSPYDYTGAEYEMLARVNPNNPSILYNMGWKFFEEGRHQEARDAFERVLTINPDDEDAIYNLMIVRLYLEVQLSLTEA